MTVQLSTGLKQPAALRAAGALSIAALIAVVVGLILGGGAQPLLLGDPGPLLRWATPVVKLILNLSLATTVGTLVLASYATSSSEWVKLRPLAAAASALWFASAVIYFLLTYLKVSAVELSFGPEFGQGLLLFATEIELGSALAINAGFAALVSILVLAVNTPVWLLVTTAASLAAIYPLAEIGHASSDANHSLAVNSLLMHIAAISVWVGGLVALYSLRASVSAERIATLTARYSTLALIAFLLVAASGFASGYIRLYQPSDLLGTGYGQLLIVKAAVLTVLAVFGARYRLGLVGRLNAGESRSFWRLILLELGVMGLAMGFAAALANTALPEDPNELAALTPAQILTGNPLPPELTPLAWFTVFKPDVLWLAISVGAIALYLIGVRALRKRGDTWPIGRTVSWIAGFTLLAYVTSGAPSAYGEYLFSAHMIGHMMLSMLVPVLMVPGAPVTLISRAVPARKDDSRGLREWVLWAVHTPYAAFISHPLVAAANFAMSLVLFYYTPLFRWANEEHLGHQWMLVHFVITGYLFVQALVGVDPVPHRIGFPLKIMLLIGTMAFHAFFGLGLMAERSLLLADWYGAMGRTWGVDPLADQQEGGAIAWGIGELPTIVLTLIVVWQWSRSDNRERKRLDRASDRTGNKDLSDYNEMLKRLSEADTQR
jgi:cytochrome c oxidase assembly factor CtaG/putative copper export protein